MFCSFYLSVKWSSKVQEGGRVQNLIMKLITIDKI